MPAVLVGAAMLPAAWPAFRLYRGLGTRLELVLFAFGYLAVWVAAAALLMQVIAPAGALLAVAGLYQLGPLQAVSLRRCRAPLGLLVRRSGLRAGFEYAIACTGCCAGLMLALVALDAMMSVLWMSALVVVVLAEKTLRHGVLMSRVAGVAILALAAVTLL
jgi:predicted metal-binding membrane protein